MDDCNDENYNNGLVDSSSYIICGNNIAERDTSNGTADQISSHPLGKKNQAKKVKEMSVHVTRPTSALKKTATQKTQANDSRNITLNRSEIDQSRSVNSPESYCQVRLESIIKLKDSTRKLLYLLEDIEMKTHLKDLPPPDDDSKNELKTIQRLEGLSPPTNFVSSTALQKLEYQTKTIDTIYIEDEDDDCSIFKRLTRKCNCLNQLEYNDFVIHFNEDTKYFTSTIGEIIKNMRILKKFLYMGGTYTKNALIFLNEGLTDSSYTEKVEITQGCAHSDMCNVFEDHSIVVMCVSWPCKFEYYGDNVTQSLAAAFLYKLAQLEEGRRYLKFTSKITNDIKRLLRKKGSKLDMDTTESLNAIINLMHPPMTQHINVTSYYCRPIHEGFENETIKALIQYRNYMTLDEIFMNLDLLHNMSNEQKGKTDFTLFLPDLLRLFKQMLKEYDNSEMNIIITNILNNILSKNVLKQKEAQLPKTLKLADTATEPIKMKNEINQMPPPQKKKNSKKANNKSKSCLGSTPNKFRQASRRKVSEWETPLLLNRSKKFTKDRNNVIVVPIENKINALV